PVRRVRPAGLRLHAAGPDGQPGRRRRGRGVSLHAGRAVRDGADDRGRRRARTRHRALRSVPPGRGGSGMNKVVTCEEVVAQIEDGATVAIGGSSLSRKPMALVRALARRNRNNLRLIVTAGGPAVALPIATGPAAAAL